MFYIYVHWYSYRKAVGDFVCCCDLMKVALRWQIQRGLAVVPKSNSINHQRENICVSYLTILCLLAIHVLTCRCVSVKH